MIIKKIFFSSYNKIRNYTSEENERMKSKAKRERDDDDILLI